MISGYPVEALSGPAGGYQLAPGGALPPLLFDDDEAMAVALGLRAAAGGTVPGFEDAAVAALAKIEQVLPVRLADQINSVQSATVALRSRTNRESSPVEPGVLVTVAQACRGPERLRFDYVDREGNVTERHVEPYRLVHTSRRWYLVARDRDRDAWRTFRVDRMSNPKRTGMWFTHTDPPDAAALVAEGISVQVYRYQARILLHVPHEQAVEMIGPVVGVLERRGRNRTLLAHRRRRDRMDRRLPGRARLPLRGARARRVEGGGQGARRAAHRILRTSARPLSTPSFGRDAEQSVCQAEIATGFAAQPDATRRLKSSMRRSIGSASAWMAVQ